MKYRNTIQHQTISYGRELAEYAKIIDVVGHSRTLLVRVQILHNLLDKVLLHETLLHVSLQQAERVHNMVQPPTDAARADTPDTLLSLFRDLVAAVEQELETYEASTAHCMQTVGEVTALISTIRTALGSEPIL